MRLSRLRARTGRTRSRRARPRGAAAVLATLAVVLVTAAYGSGAYGSDAQESNDARASRTASSTAASTAVGATSTGYVGGAESAACRASPRERTTYQGVAYLRTPDACFDDLPDWPYRPRYDKINGLRQAYIDVGPRRGKPILLLHGQPSWSYLYHDVVPVLVDQGYRVIAMDNLGMGRSDKPVDLDYYTYDVHAERLARFIDDLDLDDLTVFAQDWGSILALWDYTDDPDTFERIVIGNGGLPESPQPFEILDADDPAIDEFDSLVNSVPAQQEPFFDENGNPLPTGGSGGSDLGGFGTWASYAYHSEDFHPSTFVEALTYRDLAPEEQAAYDAPFPTRDYMAGPRTFPSLLNELVGRTDDKRQQLTTSSTPFLTIFGGNDPGLVGSNVGEQEWMSTQIPGAAGQPHHTYPDASHFLQEDRGEDIAVRIGEFIRANPT